jgi:hypothetical protein
VAYYESIDTNNDGIHQNNQPLLLALATSLLEGRINNNSSNNKIIILINNKERYPVDVSLARHVLSLLAQTLPNIDERAKDILGNLIDSSCIQYQIDHDMQEPLILLKVFHAHKYLSTRGSP